MRAFVLEGGLQIGEISYLFEENDFHDRELCRPLGSSRHSNSVCDGSNQLNSASRPGSGSVEPIEMLAVLRKFRPSSSSSSLQRLSSLFLSRPMSTRTYSEAIDALNSLLSNAATLEAMRVAGGTARALAIPEMIEYLHRIGYSVSLDLALDCIDC